MENICFVVMPFGGQFDAIYQQIYKPAIHAAGLEPLRADDIYDNQSIIHDIRQSIQNAVLILADVTGRNPNVNYELGIAHGLGKEVIILTSNPEDVPSDYRHLRYLRYNPSGIGWDRQLSGDLLATLKTVLHRLHIPSGSSRILPSDAGFYEADIVKIYHKENTKHYFYKLDGLLPLSELGDAESYIADESHWLADWNQDNQRFHVGETVKFRVIKVSAVNTWGHVSNARNVSFAI